MYTAAAPSGRGCRTDSPTVLTAVIPPFVKAKGEKYLSKKTEATEQKSENKATKLEISEKDRRAFLTALKIGYYKEFHKQGILSDEELEYLINLQAEYSA